MKITVKKYDPSKDAAPYYVSGEIEYREHMSALEALVEFYETVEGVNYDLNCTSAWCGRCAMMLNGEPCLVCVTPVEDAEYVFEPLEGFPVIRDLVVDKNSMHDRICALSERVKLEDFTAETIVPEEFDATTTAQSLALEECCRCGVCTAGCPAKAAHPVEFCGPSEMAAIAYRYLDQLDRGDRVLEAVQHGLYYCIMCGRCDQNCPHAEITHVELWQRLRDEAEARGLKPSYADDVAAHAEETLQAYLNR